MDFNLINYLRIYPAFDLDTCNEIIKNLEEDNSWVEHRYTTNIGYEDHSFENEFLNCYIAGKNRDMVMQSIWETYLRYLTELEFSWFSSWSGHSEVRFNKYDNNNWMRYHCDHIHALFEGERRGVPVITALGTLNDNYEGGRLLFWDNKEVVIPPGHIAVFPSNFLYPHMVEPVTKGARYSFVSWAW